jgi:hypothetical protein
VHLHRGSKLKPCQAVPDAFDTVAGRYILMLFIGSAGAAEVAAALGLIENKRALFDDKQACFFGVTVDPEDEANGRIRRRLPGIRWFLDYDAEVSRLYGAASGEGTKEDRMRKLVFGLSAISLAAIPVSLPTVAKAQSAQNATEFCGRLVDEGRYESLGECMRVYRTDPASSCRFLRTNGYFPAYIDDWRTGEPRLVDEQGQCVAMFRHF